MEQKINSADLELKDRLVAINRVTKVTKGGRTFSFSAIVVVGDENGTVGYGLGKANEVTTAIAKGVEAAKKNLIKVPVLKGTLPHEQEAKYSGATVFMRPASSGTGRSGTHEYSCTTIFSLLLVRKSSFQYRYFNQIFLRSLNAFCNSSSYLVSFT